MKPVIPAEKAELISVARAMNREEFGPRLQKLFHPETEAATDAIQSGKSLRVWVDFHAGLKYLVI